MADDDKDSKDAGKNGENQNGQEEKDPDKKNPDQKPDNKGINAGDLAEMTKKLASMEDLVKKQQDVIDQFKNVGKESPPSKTDQERIQELESTLELFKKKMESDKQAQEAAAKAKREQAVDALIKEIPEFKEMRDTLMNVDDTVLALFTKRQASTTPDPVGRVGTVRTSKGDWEKKLALAAERRKKHNETLQNIKY